LGRDLVISEVVCVFMCPKSIETIFFFTKYLIGY